LILKEICYPNLKKKKELPYCDNRYLQKANSKYHSWWENGESFPFYTGSKTQKEMEEVCPNKVYVTLSWRS
jgi:hypothetical protein